MKTTSDYWKNWFDNRAKGTSSDYILNRGTTLRLTELEARAERQFLAAVDPKPSDVVLDAGCGSGRNISTLSPRVNKIVGVDFSEAMLLRARERVVSENLTNVELGAGSVTNLQFPDGTFDKVICASVLQYLDAEDCEKAFREMVRVSKDQAIMVLHVKNGTSLYAISLKAMRAVSRLIGRKVQPEYYRSRVWHVNTLKKCGANVIGFDGFGVFTFVPLPRWMVQMLLKLELSVVKPDRLRKFAVNYKLTLRVNKSKQVNLSPKNAS